MKLGKYILQIIFFFISLVYLSSCSISSVSLDVVRPAEIDVPNHIQNIVIINRSLPSKSNQAENILDGLFSGEGVGDDKKGAKMCVVSLKKSLLNKPSEISRFNLIESDALLEGNQFLGTGTSIFPKPIKWKKLNKLSEKYDFDGVIVLETFDSKSSIINAGVVEKNKRVNGQKIKKKYIEAYLNIQVNAGWRIYDLVNKKIIDEKVFTDFKEFSSLGNNFEDAKRNLPVKRAAIAETGSFAGSQYSLRISPSRESVNRFYYLKATRGDKEVNKSFQKASDLLRKNSIDNAALIWINFVDFDDHKIASRACFNMALAAELKNNYNLAIEWIEKSLDYNYSNKKTIDYLRVLKQRQEEIKRIKNQLNN